MAEFAGRQWLFSRLAAWERGDARVLLIEGPPGSGKTAFAERLAEAGGLAYAHFCRSGKTSTTSPLTFVHDLSEALAARDEKVRRALLEAHPVRVNAVGAVQVREVHPGAEVSGVHVDITMHRYPATLAYEELVRKPLERAGSTSPTVLVDALDEGAELGLDSIAELLSQVVTDTAPGGVRFVLTSRSADPRVDDRFPDAERIHLVRDAPPGERDLRDFLVVRLAAMPERERQVAVDRIAGAAGGIFLYARHVADTLLADPAAWSRVESVPLPGSLTEVYGKFLTRSLVRDEQQPAWRERLRPVLALLAVARGDGLPEWLLAAVSGLARPEAHDAVTDCRQFLEIGVNDRIRIFHESFREFLLSTSPYPLFTDDARDALCRHLLLHHAPDWRSEDDRYSVENLPRHLLDSSTPGQAATLLTDLAFVEAKIAEFGVPALMRDLATAAGEVPAAEDAGRLRQLYDVIDRSAYRLWTDPAGDRPGRVGQQLLLAVRDREHAWIAELAERHLEQIGTPFLRTKWHVRSESPALLRTLAGHRDGVVSVTTDASSKRALSASADGTARLWDIGTGEPLAVLGPHAAGLVTAAFVRDETAILTAATDGSLGVWDARTGELMDWHDVESGIAVVEVAGDGSSCLVGSREGTLLSWDFATAPDELLPAAASAISLIRADDRVVVAGTAGGELHVWRADDRTYLGVLTGHTDRVSGLRLVGQMRAVSMSADGSLRWWDLASLTCVREIRPDGVSQYYDLAWVPGSPVVLCAGNAWSVDVYDVLTGDALERIRSDNLLPMVLAMAPDGTTALATSVEDRRIRVVDMASREVTGELCGHGDLVDGVCVTADSRLALTVSHDRTVRVWDLAAASGDGFDGHGAAVRAMSAAPHRNLLLSSSSDDTLRGWDLETGEPRLFFSRIQQFIYAIDAAAFENFALVGDQRGDLLLFPTGDDAQLTALDYSRGAPPSAIAETERGVSSIAVFSNLRLVVSAHWHDSDVRVWNLLGGTRLVHTLSGHTKGVWRLAVLPGGLVASAGQDGVIRAWDVVAGTSAFTLSGGDDAEVLALAADPSGRFLLAGCADGTLRLWDVTERRELRRIAAHDAEVIAVAWPSPGVAYSSGSDRRLVEWAVPECTQTIAVDMGSVITTVAAAGGAVCCGTLAGEVFSLTRVPAVEYPSGFQGDDRFQLPSPPAARRRWLPRRPPA
ncbi:MULTISPECIES: WD40 repeat domain-containing protein [Saccharothrix]|uniref:WD40 repeat domain-containing protein n=1 Tax=Saccharothrix TaxID=2071 RepID=UPI00093FC842|nr:WD40 repeat domain-containing protein [Saccharothrix sp. CB00851]OKI32040.1 hypothetical protein A6A25_26745 [Saccharothrix sp. CB00851]